MAAYTYDIKHNHNTEANLNSGGSALATLNWGFATDTRRLVVNHGGTYRYFWDSTRMSDTSGDSTSGMTYGAGLVGSAGLTGVTPRGGSSGSTGTVYDMLVGLKDYMDGTFVDGSGAANRVAYWSDADTLTSSANLTFDDSTLALTGAQTISSTLQVSGLATFAASIGMSLTASVIRQTTSDAADNGSITIAGGGSASNGRGGRIELYGNEHASTGKIILTAGNVTGAAITLNTAGSDRVTVTHAGTVEFSTDIVFTASTGVVRSNTSDGADNKRVDLAGGGSSSQSRGASILVHGNEHATEAGRMYVSAGDVSTGDIIFRTSTVERVRIAYNGETIFGLGGSSQGSIFRTATNGFNIRAFSTGSTNDLTIRDSSDNVLFQIPAGTWTGVFTVGDNAASAFVVRQSSNEYLNITTTNSAEVITYGNTTTNPIHRFLGGSGATAGIRLSTNLTDATNKEGRIKVDHYTNSEEPVSVFLLASQSASSTLNIGGGQTAENAVTTTNFYVAATNTTTTGTSVFTLSGLAATFFTAGYSSSGTTLVASFTNGSNTASSAIQHLIQVAGTTAADAFTSWGISGGQHYSFGIDNSATDAFVGCRGTALGTTNWLSVSSDGSVNISTAGSGTYASISGVLLSNSAELAPGSTSYSTTSSSPTDVGSGAYNCFILTPNAGSIQFVRITQGADGQFLWIHNAGAAGNDLQVTNTNRTTAGSTNLYLAPGESAFLRYSGTLGFWLSSF